MAIPASRRSGPIALAIIAILSLLRAPAPASAGETHDRWYVLSVQGKRAGWMHDHRETAGNTIVSTSEIRLELRRADQTVRVRLESEFVETTDGKPVSMKQVQSLGADPTTESFRFGKDGISVTTAANGSSRTTSQPTPAGTWLTPAAASRYIRDRLESGAREISLRVIDPTSGIDPVMYRNTVLERTRVEVMGKTVPAVKWRVTTEEQPGASIVEYVDEDGVPIRSETKLGGLSVEIVLADRALALAKVNAPELLVSTLVSPDRAIERPRASKRATFVLSTPGEEMPVLPRGPHQALQALPDGSLRVTVDTGRATPAAADDQPRDSQKQPSAIVSSDDAEVRRLVSEATAGLARGTPADMARRAESMRTLVNRTITAKNLGVGFAAAAEVARTKSGDCTEHAVLLAAMLRADGIPARVVSGLIYAEEFEGKRDCFGYHMWTQAWLGGSGAWTDLDAVLPPGAEFDATHIALATSDLSDSETTNALVSLVPLLGKLRIKVESVEY